MITIQDPTKLESDAIVDAKTIRSTHIIAITSCTNPKINIPQVVAVEHKSIINIAVHIKITIVRNIQRLKIYVEIIIIINKQTIIQANIQIVNHIIIRFINKQIIKQVVAVETLQTKIVRMHDIVQTIVIIIRDTITKQLITINASKQARTKQKAYNIKSGHNKIV